jgi:hypothetical protein
LEKQLEMWSLEISLRRNKNLKRSIDRLDENTYEISLKEKFLVLMAGQIQNLEVKKRVQYKNTWVDCHLDRKETKRMCFMRESINHL